MAVVVKAMHSTKTHNILLESLLSDCLNVLKRFGIMKDTKLLML